MENASAWYDLFRELSSLDALTLGGATGSKERSATGSALLDKRAERLARKYANEFHAFVNRVFRTISQIDRSLMTRKQVQEIVGPEVEVNEEIWPNDWDDDAVLAEYDVVIEAESMRYVSEEQRVADQSAMEDRWIQFVAQLPSVMKEMGAKAASIMADKFFQSILRHAELLGIPNPEEILVTADELLEALEEKAEEDRMAAERQAQQQAQMAAQSPGSVQPQAMPRPGTPGPEVPTAMTPQAISEQVQMILDGTMDVEQAPPEVQQAAMEVVAQQQ